MPPAFKCFIPKVKMKIEDLRVCRRAKNSVATDFRRGLYPLGAGPGFHGMVLGFYIFRDEKMKTVVDLRLL
jgi:hypothetical protein